RPVPPDRRARRTAQLLAGLVLYGATAAMMVLAGLGLDPWDVLHQGLSRTLGLGIGTWAILASFVVLLGWLPLRQRLGVGTVANAVAIGPITHVTIPALAIRPSPSSLRAARRTRRSSSLPPGALEPSCAVSSTAAATPPGRRGPASARAR